MYSKTSSYTSFVQHISLYTIQRVFHTLSDVLQCLCTSHILVCLMPQKELGIHVFFSWHLSLSLSLHDAPQFVEPSEVVQDAAASSVFAFVDVPDLYGAASCKCNQYAL